MFVFSKRLRASISIFSCIHGNRLPEPGLERVRESPDGRRDLRAGRSRAGRSRAVRAGAGRAGALDTVFIRHEVRFSALCAPKRTGRFRPIAPPCRPTIVANVSETCLGSIYQELACRGSPARQALWYCQPVPDRWFRAPSMPLRPASRVRLRSHEVKTAEPPQKLPMR